MTDTDIFQAAMDNAEAYHKEVKADDPDVEIVAEWKEIAFFEQGAKWAQKKIIDAACEWLSNCESLQMRPYNIELFKQAMEKEQ